ncbi:MAG: GNAT family N-acetyltransferase [Bacilli bacterium]|nr:GNAT family N-acetyltransferase [Bacilli bacterium]
MRITPEQLKDIESFQNEKDMFYIISLISKGEDPQLISDLNNYVIARSDVGYPIWIWTKEDLSKEKEKEILSELNVFFEKGENKFTSKKEIYDLLKKKYETLNELEMGFLSCEEAVKPLKGKGIFVKPNYADKVTLAEYWRDNLKELYKKTITQWEALEEIENWLEEKKFYVLKDASGEIVCMAGYSIVDDLAKITHVYTPRDERRKGYCQYLIYSLSKMLLEEGYKPILYTDYQYEASNRAYQKVGFKDQGTLMNYSIHKN